MFVASSTRTARMFEDPSSDLPFSKALKSPISFSLKSIFVSVSLSFAVSALVAAAWGVGVLASPAALFMFDDRAKPSMAPQVRVVLLLVSVAGLGSGFALERLGARRALVVVAGALVVLYAASLAVSRFLHLDIGFEPMMFAAAGALAVGAARRLLASGAALTR